MTVSTQVATASYIGNGVTTIFPFSFPVYESSHLKVRLYNLLNNAYVELTDYTTTGIGPDSTGGTVTYSPAISSSQFLLIYRELPFVQETSIKNQEGFYPEVIEHQLDLIVMQIQQLATAASQLNTSAIRVPTFESVPALPPAGERAYKWFSFDGEGNPLLGSGPVVNITDGAADFASALSAFGAALPPSQTFFSTAGYYIAGDNGEGLYVVRTDEPAHAGKIPLAGGKWGELVAAEIRLEQFGGKNDGLTPADTALDNAYAYLMQTPNGGTLVFLAGAGYLFTAEHNIFPAKPLCLRGEKGSQILCGITGADKVLFRATNPVTPITRGVSLNFADTRIKFHSSITADLIGAKFFEHRYASDLKFTGFNFWSHYRNNALISLSATWNCDIENLSLWGGGIRKPRKLTGSARFSITSATTALTSDTAIFDAGDEGDILVVDNEHHVIQTVLNSTSVTTARPSTQTQTSLPGTFGSVRATTTAANANVSLDGAVASVSDIGRTVYIFDCVTGQGTGSPLRAHRATITAVPDASTITLDTAPPLSASQVEIVFSPAAEIYHDVGSFDGQPNDIVCDGLHLEGTVGTGLVVKGGVNLWFKNLKSHGVGLNQIDGSASDYGLIVDDASVDVPFGQFEAQSCGRLGRVLVTGAFGKVTVSDVQGLAMRKQSWLQMQNCSAAAVVTAERWYSAAGLDVGTMARAFTKTGSGKLISGRVSAYTVDYSLYPALFGNRPPHLFYPTGTEVSIARNGNAFLALMSVGTPTFSGYAVSGSPEAPGPTADFTITARLTGYGISPDGTLQQTASVSTQTRDSSGAILPGQLAFSTRDLSGSLADRWYISTTGHLTPAANNTYDLGTSSARVREIFASNAVINTSDERAKTAIEPIPAEWLDAWESVEWVRYKWRDAVEEKGNDARWHIGLIAQHIRDVFTARGLDAFEIGLLCYDEWEAEEAREAVFDEDNNEIIPAFPGRTAGERYGLRYEECLALEAAVVRRKFARLEGE